MPIFDFKCSECNVITEKMVKMNQDEIDCIDETCSSAMQKMISAPASIKFKGTGFYETDFKNK